MGRRRASIDWCPASPPVSHTHIDSPSTRLVQQPCRTSPPFDVVPLLLLPALALLSLSRPFSVLPFSSPLRSSPLHRYFPSLGLSAAVCLPIIPPSPCRASFLHRPSFFSMSTNNSLPFYSYFLFRFSPAYSRTAESPLFPRTVPICSLLLSHSSSELRRFLPPPAPPPPSSLSKPRSPSRSRRLLLSSPPPSRTRARSRFFPTRAAFSLAVIID